MTQYNCPLCQQPLTANPQGFACPDKHQFDRAKEGYVNLLPVQNKASKVPGDSKEMVLARRDFLASTAYQFLQLALIEQLKALQVKAQLPEQATIIDVGCGEGYYTNALSNYLDEKPVGHQVYGVDIAKAAVRFAAKRYKTVDFAVASHLNLPFADDFADMISKIFAPVTVAEVIRVLKPGGLLLTVVPGPQHLFELKGVIYDYPKAHEPEVCPAGFELINSESLSTKQTLSDPVQIANLIQMTPFSWKIDEQKRQQLIADANLVITFDFVVNVYRISNHSA